MTVMFDKATSVEVETDKIPDGPISAYIFSLGLAILIRRGKGTKGNAGLSPQEIAEKNVAALYAGNVRIPGVKAPADVSGKVMVEARRMARQMVKDEIKANGGKVSHYEASEITRAANALIAADPTIIEDAKASLEALAKKEKPKVKLDLVVNPDLVAKAEAKKKGKAKEGEPISAKQASTPKVPGRPPVPPKGGRPEARPH